MRSNGTDSSLGSHLGLAWPYSVVRVSSFDFSSGAMRGPQREGLNTFRLHMAEQVSVC